jgi:formyl-CoA transferase
MRDQLRLDKLGYLEEYPQYPHGTFSDVVPRGGNAGGGGQPGWVLKCKGWETDPNAYIYFTVQGHAWAPICDAIGKPEWKTDPDYTTAKARQPHITAIFATIEEWLADKTKFEAVDILRKFDIPCSPVLTMKELLHDESLRKSGSIVEVKGHKERGNYFTVGSPIKFSDLKPEITPSPLLGEHTDEVLVELGYSKEQITNLRESKAV